MFINPSRQEIIFKIVYYGPGLGGKTANLLYIYEHINPALRSELITLKTKEDRTLFFDFLQLEVGKIKGRQPRFNIYTTPGQIQYDSSRKIVLSGADGIVFVADSQRDRLSDNLQSMAELEEYLIENGLSLAKFPWVLQYNKRDLHDILSVQVMEEKLNFCRIPHFESVATRGEGTFETLKACIYQIVNYFGARSLTESATV